jgi:hypothetical protein
VINTPTSLKPVLGAGDAAFAPRAARLHDEGLTLPAVGQARVAISSVMPLAVVLLFLAAPRLVMGLAGGHRVGFLVIESLVGGFVAVILILAGSWRLSNRGRALLERQKKRHDTLRVGEQWSGGGDAGMAVALFGTAVLAGTVVAPLQTWYPRQTADASASGCSSGCGSGCTTSSGSSDSGGSSDGGSGCSSGCGGGCGGGGD